MNLANANKESVNLFQYTTNGRLAQIALKKHQHEALQIFIASICPEGIYRMPEEYDLALKHNEVDSIKNQLKEAQETIESLKSTIAELIEEKQFILESKNNEIEQLTLSFNK